MEGEGYQHQGVGTLEYNERVLLCDQLSLKVMCVKFCALNMKSNLSVWDEITV